MNAFTRSFPVPAFTTLPRTRHVICAAFALFNHAASGAPGDLDLTFGGTGKVTTSIGIEHDSATAMVLQADGQILVAGPAWIGADYDFAVVRYNTDGSLDTSFNGTGKVTTNIGISNSASGIAIQSNGKIVVAGIST